uniref:Uncharacterized protein n=1 Tax=Anguilla anguilla TaxID=7936 RepID=A0A0E9SVI0_ANGAN
MQSQQCCLITIGSLWSFLVS